MGAEEQREQKFNRMTQTPIPKLICQLAVPTIISMLVTSFYNMADTFFVGKINKGALSILPNQQGLTAIPGIVQATKSDISADLTGFSAKSSEVQEIGETTVVSE